MKRRLEAMSVIGIPSEFHSYPGLGHGFGSDGGWVNDYADWLKNIFKK